MAQAEMQTQTRRLVIKDKVFKAEDLRRIAKIFEKQKLLSTGSGHDARVNYKINFSDNSMFESGSQSLFSDESLITAVRPTAIEMSFRNYSTNCYLRISISHGDKGYGNEVEISGTDLVWVRENFMAIKEGVDTIAPQNVWFRRHNALLNVLLFCAIILIYILIYAANAALRARSKTQAIPLWLLPVFAGGSLGVGAFAIRDWLLSSWPSIEFDFGAEHLREELIGRRRLKLIVAFIVIPIVVGLLVELL